MSDTPPDSNVDLMPDEPLRLDGGGFEKVFLHCEHLHASDITFQSNSPVYAQVYSRLVQITKRKLSNTEVGEILNSIYGPNGTTQLLGGKDVDTHFEFRPNRNERYRYRINGTACMVEGQDGIQITARSIPTTPPALDSLDLPQSIIDAAAPSQGVVYVTGTTGSGKSTLLAAIIRHLAEMPHSNRKILTYEAPIEFVYDDIPMPNALVSQSEIPRHLPSFAAGVRNALRRMPRAILVGESRDKETIGALLEAALTGHPVYTTLHANGVAETVRRLVTSFPAEERFGRTVDIIETMRLVVWQQLVPTTEGKLVALREYLVFTEEVRDKLLAEDPSKITAATRRLLREQGQTMDVDAKRQFDAGRIGEREYNRFVRLSHNLDRDAELASTHT